MIELITTIAGYTYADTLSNYETRDVGEQTRRVYHTGIQVAVTGIVDTATEGSFPGDWIDDRGES